MSTNPYETQFFLANLNSSSFSMKFESLEKANGFLERNEHRFSHPAIYEAKLVPGTCKRIKKAEERSLPIVIFYKQEKNPNRIIRLGLDMDRLNDRDEVLWFVKSAWDDGVWFGTTVLGYDAKKGTFTSSEKAECEAFEFPNSILGAS